jgi:hypothetical protein
MLFAGIRPPNAPRLVMRRQSTAAPTAWRTWTSSNGGLLVSMPTYVSASDGVSRSCGPRVLS